MSCFDVREIHGHSFSFTGIAEQMKHTQSIGAGLLFMYGSLLFSIEINNMHKAMDFITLQQTKINSF